jgi:hemerythrin-like domain-containing protein
MKRHRSLYPLSRDHHHALVQARNLSLAAAVNDPDSSKQAAVRFAGFWESDLQWHFSQEEQFVLPLLAKHKPPDSHEIRETLRQHAEITRLVAELNDKLGRREIIEANLLDALGEALRSHIHFEENELFPALEASATEEDLWRMNEQLEAKRSRTGQGGCALTPKPQATEG